MTESIGLIITIFFAAVGVLLLANELRLRRAWSKVSLEFQKQELDFKKQELKEKRQEREDLREWLERETLRVTQLSDHIAGNIVRQLKDDANWAFEALDKAKLIPHAQTLFADRLRHFRDEKELLADRFVPLLLARCKRLVESGKTVYLLIDSGTTLYPLFDRLGRESVLCYANKERWIDNLVLVTNNLAGIEALFQSGLVNPHHRYSSLAVTCHLLPGVPLPIYSAVTGQEANDAIQRLRDNSNNSPRFIGLTTGNWIRLRRSAPNCPVPLARGTGHLELKQILIDNSDEIYVVTPLGKIFVDIAPEDVNRALGFSEDHRDPDRHSYREVDVSDEKARHVRIVTTTRVHGRVLSNLSNRVSALLSLNGPAVGQYTTAYPEQIPHIAFPFDVLPDNWYLQIETEFPHPHTRREDLMHSFFFVPRSQLTQVEK